MATTTRWLATWDLHYAEWYVLHIETEWVNNCICRKWVHKEPAPFSSLQPTKFPLAHHCHRKASIIHPVVDHPPGTVYLHVRVITPGVDRAYSIHMNRCREFTEPQIIAGRRRGKKRLAIVVVVTSYLACFLRFIAHCTESAGEIESSWRVGRER